MAEFSTATWLYTSTNGHRAYISACANFANLADTYSPFLKSLGLEVLDELHDVDSLRSKMSSIPSGSHLCWFREVCLYQAADSLWVVAMNVSTAISLTSLT